MSVVMQALVAAAVAVVLVLVGVYVPGSPIAREREEVDSAAQQRKKLNQEVTQLQVYEQRKAELKQQMDALNAGSGQRVQRANPALDCAGHRSQGIPLRNAI